MVQHVMNCLSPRAPRRPPFLLVSACCVSSVGHSLIKGMRETSAEHQLYRGRIQGHLFQPYCSLLFSSRHTRSLVSPPIETAPHAHQYA